MYGIQRIAKYKKQDIPNLQKAAMRMSESYNDDIDISKSKDNIELINCGNWLKKINDIISYTKVKVRKDSIFAVGGLYTASKDFFEIRLPQSHWL